MHRLDFLDLEDTQIGLPLMEAIERITHRIRVTLRALVSVSVVERRSVRHQDVAEFVGDCSVKSSNLHHDERSTLHPTSTLCPLTYPMRAFIEYSGGSSTNGVPVAKDRFACQ